MVKRAAAILLGLGSITACAGILGFERLSEEGLAEAGAAQDTSTPDVDAGIDAGDPRCAVIGIPDRPPADAGLDDGAASVRVAIKVFDLGIDKAKPAAGFNLDRTCSTDIATSSCTTKVDEANFARYGADRGAGIDNAGVALLEDVGQVGTAFKADSINARLASGEYGVVITVLDWNGSPEDDTVRVEVFPAVRVKSASDGGAKPAFQSGDEWVRDARFELITGSGVSRIKAVTAYVTAGRVVAFFDLLTLPVSTPDDPKPVDIKLRESWVSAKIVTDGPGHRLDDGVGGGRWATADLLAEVRTIYIKESGPFRDVYVCDSTGKLFYDAVKDAVCKARDLRSASRDDNTNVPCNAFSVGLRFETYRLDKIGPFADRPNLPARCVDAAVPGGDDCP